MAMDGIFGDYQNIYSAKPITKNQDNNMSKLKEFLILL